MASMGSENMSTFLFSHSKQIRIKKRKKGNSVRLDSVCLCEIPVNYLISPGHIKIIAHALMPKLQTSVV